MESRVTPMLRAAALMGAAAWFGGMLGCRIEERIPDSVASPPAATDTTAVLAELQAYYRDFSARDWEAFQSHFWPGADITTVWQRPGDTVSRVLVMPVPEFVAQAPQGPDSREIFEERPMSSRIDVQRDLATAWVRYHARFGDPGDVREWEGHDVFTLMRVGAVWKIVELAFTSEGGPDS